MTIAPIDRSFGRLQGSLCIVLCKPLLRQLEVVQTDWTTGAGSRVGSVQSEKASPPERSPLRREMLRQHPDVYTHRCAVRKPVSARRAMARRITASRSVGMSRLISRGLRDLNAGEQLVRARIGSRPVAIS